MVSNIGLIDRLLRGAIGLALVAVALGLFGPDYQTVWGWLGLVPLGTALIAWCPLYAALDIKTCKPSLATRAA